MSEQPSDLSKTQMKHLYVCLLCFISFGCCFNQSNIFSKLLSVVVFNVSRFSPPGSPISPSHAALRKHLNGVLMNFPCTIKTQKRIVRTQFGTKTPPGHRFFESCFCARCTLGAAKCYARVFFFVHFFISDITFCLLFSLLATAHSSIDL